MKKVVIEYCTQCNWMLRSAWLAQELLNTFEQELDEVSLRPATGGVFRIFANEQQIWERQSDGGFPQAKVLKQRVRDALFPSRALGRHLEDNR